LEWAWWFCWQSQGFLQIGNGPNTPGRAAQRAWQLGPMLKFESGAQREPVREFLRIPSREAKSGNPELHTKRQEGEKARVPRCAHPSVPPRLPHDASPAKSVRSLNLINVQADPLPIISSASTRRCASRPRGRWRDGAAIGHQRCNPVARRIPR
jgi:hypothetical protein